MIFSRFFLVLSTRSYVAGIAARVRIFVSEITFELNLRIPFLTGSQSPECLWSAILSPIDDVLETGFYVNHF